MGRRPEYDKFGHCIVCGINMTHERVVDGQLKRVFKPIKDSVSYMLRDGSLMRVSVCKPCKEDMSNSKEEYDMVMNKVIKGWEKECDILVKNGKWTMDRKKEYMDEYRRKEIFNRFDDIPLRNLTNINEKVRVARERMINQAREKIGNGSNNKK